MLSILDTSVLIAVSGEALDGELAISAISIAEMQFGVLRAKSDQARSDRLARLSGVLSVFDPIPVDERVAASYGRLASATVDAGRKRETRSLDLLIAATAHAYGARLVTANAKDVEHLSELVDVVAW